MTPASHLRWLLLAGLVFCTQIGAGQTVALLARTEVHKEEITLSDLFSQATPSPVRQAGERVRLGRAPQMGETRTLERAQIVRQLATEPDLLRQLTIPQQIVVRRAGYPLRREAIYNAITAYLRASGEQRTLPETAVELPHTIETASADPRLEIMGALWDAPSQRRQLDMGCVPRTACASFLVYIREPKRLSGHRPETLPPRPLGPKTVENPFLIKAGQRVIMLVEAEKIHISLQVICLQSGRLGQTIRVLDPVRRRVFRAQVLASHLLQVKS